MDHSLSADRTGDRHAMAERLSASIARVFLHKHAVSILFAIYCTLRAAVIFCHVTPTSDADWYYSHAVQLAQGMDYLNNQGRPTAFWPVGLPWLLSLAFRVGGASLWTVGIVNGVAAGLTGWMILDLGRRWTGSELAARFALFAFALYPNAIAYVPLALTEVIYTALLISGIWLITVSRAWYAYFLAGLVFGLATLVKAQTMAIVPLLLAISLWQNWQGWRSLRTVIGQGLLIGLAAAVIISPWTLRNHRELGAWVMVSANGGFTLLTGNNDSARGGYTPNDPLVTGLQARKDLNEIQADGLARQLGMTWIREHPARFVALVPLKIARLWGPDGEGQWAYETGSTVYSAHPHIFLALRAANQVWYLLLLIGFIVAPLRLASRSHRFDWWLVPYAVALFETGISVAFSGQSRFHFPAMPFVCLTVGWLVADWVSRRAKT